MAAFSGVLAGLADKLKFKEDGVQTETSVNQVAYDIFAVFT